MIRYPLEELDYCSVVYVRLEQNIHVLSEHRSLTEQSCCVIHS